MKKLTFVDLSPFRGGAEISLEKLINVIPENYEIEMIVSRDDIWLFKRHVKFSTIKMDERFLLLNKTIKNLILFFFQIVKNINNFKRKDELFFTNTFKSHFAIFMISIFFGKTRWIVIERDFYENSLIKFFKKLLYKKTLGVIFNSKFLKRKYHFSNSQVIYNIVESKTLSKKDFKTFLYIGDPTYEKGYDRIFEFFRYIYSMNHNFRLTIVLREKNFYGKRVKDITNISKTVFGDYNDIDKILKESSFLLLFNRKTETFSRVVAEGMSYGLIPFVLKGNGMDDYVFNLYNGFVFEEYDPELIVKSFMENYDEEKFLLMQKRSYETVINFFSEKNIKMRFLNYLEGKFNFPSRGR